MRSAPILSVRIHLLSSDNHILFKEINSRKILVSIHFLNSDLLTPRNPESLSLNIIRPELYKVYKDYILNHY